MAENKTIENDLSVTAFLNRIEDEKRRQDCFTLLELFQEAVQEPPKMWGEAIVGYGSYHYIYESGRQGDSPLAGFSPRKQNLTLYIEFGFEQFDGLLARLGKYKTSKYCLYINKVEDIDLQVLKEMVRLSADHVRKTQISR
jgi:hypothetical protein